MEELGVMELTPPLPHSPHSLTKALEDLFEKSLAEAAAEELDSHALVRFSSRSVYITFVAGRLGVWEIWRFRIFF